MTARARRRWIGYLPRYLVMVPITLAFLFPFYWMLVIATGTLQTVFQFPPILYPLGHWENFLVAWGTLPDPSTDQLLHIDWPRFYFNTVLIAVLTTLGVLFTSVLAGYAFASMSFPGKALVFGLVLAIYMVPTEVTLVPNFIILKDLSWIDTYQAQIVPFAASVFGIFLMRQFFLTLPRDLWEAAQLDGCGHLRYLSTIALPLAQAPLITIALFHFVGSWNAFLWPLIMTTSESVRPIQVALQYFSYADATNPVTHSAGSLLVTAPILIIFVFAQRYLVGGIASTGIRG